MISNRKTTLLNPKNFAILNTGEKIMIRPNFLFLKKKFFENFGYFMKPYGK